MAISDAFNKELHDLADAGCPVIQIEDPQIHLLAARPVPNKDITLDFMLKGFNNTVKGLREKTEVWVHTCWGNPSKQRMVARVQPYYGKEDGRRSDRSPYVTGRESRGSGRLAAKDGEAGAGRTPGRMYRLRNGS